MTGLPLLVHLGKFRANKVNVSLGEDAGVAGFACGGDLAAVDDVTNPVGRLVQMSGD